MNHYSPRSKKILVVNKCDLEGDPNAVTEENVDAAFSSMRLDRMFKVSAKTGKDVEDLVQTTWRIAREKKRRTSEKCRIF